MDEYLYWLNEIWVGSGGLIFWEILEFVMGVGNDEVIYDEVDWVDEFVEICERYGLFILFGLELWLMVKDVGVLYDVCMLVWDYVD